MTVAFAFSAMVQLAPEADVQPLHAENVLPPAVPGAGNMDHFALRLEAFDAAALTAHMKRCGVDPGAVHERYGAEGYGPSLYFTDPDGNTVELKGPATRGL